MGLPNIIISFQTKASTAIKRGERGVVAIMVIETENHGVTKITDTTQIPKDLTEANRAYVERAFLGGKSAIRHVLLIRTDTVENALETLETIKFDYLAAPPEVTEAEAKAISAQIIAMRDSKRLKVKAVLPNTAADHEGIINFTTGDIKVGEATFTAGEYCSRIAGILAGTPLSVSSTYYVLSEVDDVPKFTRSELGEKIDKGEFVLFHDGEKVKVGREVNSLLDENKVKGDIYKSIKAVDTMDLIYNDIHTTCEDSYIGKYPNNYDNKCLLVVAIRQYLEALRDDEILDTDISVGIDTEAQRDWLRENGTDVSEMDEQEIKEANTRSNVFIKGAYHILYAIEDITISFEI